MSRRAARRDRSEQDQQQQQEWVDTVESTDVMLGRGSGPNNREGNIMFRRLVKERKAEYNATKNRNTKHTIATEILESIQAQGCVRFLRKATARDMIQLGIPRGTKAWCIVDEKSILEKVKQALRQKTAWKDMTAAADDSSGRDSGIDHDQRRTSRQETSSLEVEEDDDDEEEEEEEEGGEDTCMLGLIGAAARDADRDDELLPESELLFGRDLLDSD